MLTARHALMFRLLAVVLVWRLLTMLGSSAAVAALPQEASALGERVRLPAHVLPALKEATPVAPALGAEAEPLTLTIVLKRTDQAGFDRYLHEVYDPHSPEFRYFRSQEEITAQFGPTLEAYERVLAYLQQNGFTLVQGAANRLTLTMRGTRSQAERAFGVHIRDFETGGRRFFANQTDPAVPPALAGNIQAVAGLSNFPVPRPAAIVIDMAAARVFLALRPGLQFFGSVTAALNYLNNLALNLSRVEPATEAELNEIMTILRAIVQLEQFLLGRLPHFPPPASLAPASLAIPQSLPAAPTVTGAGQKIGLLAFSSIRLTDVADWLALVRLPASLINQVSQVDVNGGAPLGPEASDVLLGIEMGLFIAPGAQVVVYHAPFASPGTSFQALFNAMINDGVTVISNSFGYCEDQTTLADVQSIDAILATAAASGISVFNATGDFGSGCRDGSTQTVAVPAGSPNATAVGGTSVTVGPGLTYAGESWWDGSTDVPPTGQGGFGVSHFFSRPAYQDGLISAPMRSVPDVVAPADPQLGLAVCEVDAGGCPTGRLHGGTSLATPIWAALAALLNDAQQRPLGFLNALLYPLAGTTAFHSAASMGTDPAHVGLGSPNGNLLNLFLAVQAAGPTDALLSLVTASSTDPFQPFPGTVLADGTAAAAIVVRLRDANGNIVTGKNVTLAVSAGSHAVITPPSGVSSVANGAVVFTVTDANVENVTFTATADGVTLTQTATVNFIGPPPTAAGIFANPTSVPDNGSTPATITVLLQDAHGHGVPGKLINLSQGSGHSLVNGPNPSVTDSNGQVQFTATDTTAETVTYTAVDATDGITVPGSAQVTFTGSNGPPCGGVATAAAGYAVTSFATGFFNSGCIGPVGIAFDNSGSVFITNFADGSLYRFGASGGIAGPSTRINATSLGAGCPAGLAFSKDGQHLYLANRCNGHVDEISPTTGQVLRTLGATCAPTALATDPLSGDLFASTIFCGAVVRIANPQAPTPTLSSYANPGDVDGITFAPDGTLYVRAPLGSISRIEGTNSSTPGAVTQVVDFPGGTGPDGIAIAVDPAHPSTALFLFVNNNNGTITKVDLAQKPVVLSDVATGGSRGDLTAVGLDGCLYATQSDRVVRVTNADGSCPFAPTSATAALGLTPTTVSPNPAQGTPETFTATFHNLSVPAGTPVTLTVIGPNLQALLERTDATGRATFTYAGTFTGTDALVATATVGTQTLTSNVAQVTWTTGPHTTFLSLNTSRGSGTVNTPLPLTATLVDVSASPAVVVPNATLHFDLAGQTCQGLTDSTGTAVCSLTPTVAAGSYPLTASFAGTNLLLASFASKTVDLVGQVNVNAPPDCSQAHPSVTTLWPPNHRMVPVAVLGVRDTDGDPVTLHIDQIVQNEPTLGIGLGDTCPDGAGIGNATALVRAERSGTGTGRVYTLHFTATDGESGSCQGQVQVCVPHDQGQGSHCVAGGPLYDSTQCPARGR